MECVLHTVFTAGAHRVWQNALLEQVVAGVESVLEEDPTKYLHLV